MASMTARKSTTTSKALARTNKALSEANEAEQRAKLAKKAHDLRLEGQTWWQIAEALKITETAAAGLVSEAIRYAATLVDESAKHQMLTVELNRLDALQRAVWPAAMAGDSRSVESVLKIMTHRSKLLGLEDATTGKQITNNTIVVPGNPAEYVAALQAMTGV